MEGMEREKRMDRRERGVSSLIRRSAPFSL